MKILNKPNLNRINILKSQDVGEEKIYIYFWGTNNNINYEYIKKETITKENEKIEIKTFINQNSEARLTQ